MTQVTFEYIGHGRTRWTTTSSRDGAGAELGYSTIRWDELLWKRHEFSGGIEVATQVFAKVRAVVLRLDGTLLVVLERVDSRLLRESEALLKAGWKQMPAEEDLDTDALCGVGGCSELARFCPGHNP